MENALGEPQTIVLMGGSSDIGRAIVSELLTTTTRSVVLAARRPDAQLLIAGQGKLEGELRALAGFCLESNESAYPTGTTRAATSAANKRTRCRFRIAP